MSEMSSVVEPQTPKEPYVIKGKSSTAKAHILLPEYGSLCDIRWWRWENVLRYVPDAINQEQHRFCEECKATLAETDRQTFGVIFPDDHPTAVISELRGEERDEPDEDEIQESTSAGRVEFFPGEQDIMRCKCNRALRARITSGFFGPQLASKTECPNCGRTYPEGLPAPKIN